MKSVRLNLLATTTIVAASIAVGAGSARAQSTWQGATTDYNLNSNWSPATAPTAAGQSAVFGSAGLGNVSVTAGVTPDSWTFNANAQTYSFTGSNVSFSTATGLVNNSANGVTIANQLLGVGAITQNGTGTLILQGSNNYTGGTTINAGTIRVENGSALGANGVTIENNATLDYQNGRIIGNDITLTSGFANFSQTGSTARQQGSISGAGGLRKVGAGNLELVGNGYTGGTIIAGGTLSANSNLSFGGGGGGSVTMMDTTRLQSIGSRTIANEIIVSDGANATFNARDAATTLNLTGAFSLGTTASAIAHFGTGVASTVALNVSSGSAIAGSSIVVEGGTLIIGAAGAVSLFQQSTGGTTVATGATLDINGFDTTVHALAGAGTVTNEGGAPAGLTATGTTSTVFSGLVVDGSGTTSLTKAGTGTLALTGTNTYTGGTTINGGTLQLGNATATGSILGNVLVNAGTLAFNRSNDYGFAGNISGNGGVRQDGSAVVTLGGTNNYSGATTINSGTLRAGAATSLSSASAFTVNAPGILDLGGFSAAIGSLAGSGTVTTGVAGAQTLTTNGNGTSTAFSGAITNGSGIVGLTKVGAGTLTLTGTNTYTGGTTITAGTLQIGTGGSFVGDVLNNATFAINSAGAFNYGGVISGTGAFRQLGSGTTTLTGTNTYLGTTTVNAGTLIVNGSIASSSMTTVNNGATLGGIGTAGNTTIASGGTLSPGNSIGVFNISGNLVLGAGAIYLVEVSPSAADRTNITGTAQLGGEARLVFGPGSYTSNSYTILSAAGGRSGTFSTMTTTGLPATLSASLTYTATDVLLVTLTSQIGPSLPGLTGTTPNQRAVATAQDAAFNSGLPNITPLYGLSLAQMPGALDQLSGEVHPTTAGVLADESLYARSTILGRLRQASYGGNTQMDSLTMGGPQAFAGDEELNGALAYGKSPIVTKAPPMQPGPDVVFWAQGFGAKGRFDGDGNATNVRRDLAGFFSGVDTRVGTSGRAGIAAGYTGSRNNLDGRGSSNVETGHIAGYGGWSFGAFNLRAGGDFAWHQIDTSRTIAFPGFFDTAAASYKGRTGQIFGEAGYGFAIGNTAVEPFAGGAWVHLTTDGFTERALVAGLNGAANSFEVGYSNVGIRAASIIPLANDMMLVPRASVAWQHAFNDVTPDGRLAFIAAPVPFVIAGTPIARDAILGEAGLDLAFGRNATIGVSYTGQLARNVQDHAAKGKFSWKF